MITGRSDGIIIPQEILDHGYRTNRPIASEWSYFDGSSYPGDAAAFAPIQKRIDLVTETDAVTGADDVDGWDSCH